MRLDLEIVKRELASTRTRAQNLIKLSRVFVNGKIADKASLEIKENDIITVSADYEESLGGIKLNGALKAFNIDVNDKVCLDIGASNGGFTEVLIKNGAKCVYALDVGECALSEKLRSDKRIIVKDKINARFISKDDFNQKIDLIVTDVSFISLELILPNIYSIIRDGGEAVALIKPQFELNKNSLTKNGIVKNKKLELFAVNKVLNFAEKIFGVRPRYAEAPHPFEGKNQEYFLYINI